MISAKTVVSRSFEKIKYSTFFALWMPSLIKNCACRKKSCNSSLNSSTPGGGVRYIEQYNNEYGPLARHACIWNACANIDGHGHMTPLEDQRSSSVPYHDQVIKLPTQVRSRDQGQNLGRLNFDPGCGANICDHPLYHSAISI